jgi:hypothetical protein
MKFASPEEPVGRGYCLPDSVIQAGAFDNQNLGK